MSPALRQIGLSRFAQRLLAARPALADELADPAPFTRAEMENALTAPGDDKRVLRELRNRVVLRVMARDLAGLADLDEVCGTMSDLAEVAVSRALTDTDLIVVGMGKLGGRELNVSSDVDLVFLYDGSYETAERYERAGRHLIRLLSEQTEDGFVFRVDMRLRPYGDSGPLACNFEALENYLITQGREWERYAWLKGRPLSGGAAGAAALEAIVRPFVFRKYLDYATLAAMRALHGEVRRDVARRELAEHVKLGPGGIREIEFIVQAIQLIRGGRDAELRVRPTLEALKVLEVKHLLPAQAAQELRDAYVFLRNLEHRLQYLDDAQRHDLPEDQEDRGRIAAMCGFGSWGDFYQQLQLHRGAVSRHFDAVFAEREAPDEAWPDHPRLAAPARSPDAGAGARRAGHPGSRGDARARRRSGRGDREPRGLPRAARRAPRGARARHAHDRRLELGGRVHHAPPAAARRAARRPAALRADRSGFPKQDSSQAAGRGTR